MTRQSSSTRWLLLTALVVVYLLHNDLWWWDDARIVLGLPIGLTYHIAYNIVAALMMFLLVKLAWPSELEVGAETGDPAASAAQGDSS